MIQEDCGEYRFIVRNQYTGERTPVCVDPDKVALFLDSRIFMERPEACPFFRYDEVSAKGYCTVHLTRPEICRDYSCWRILILDSDGNRAGRIMGSRHLAYEDEALARLFEEKINHITGLSDTDWDELVIRVLAEAGYTVRT